jgi:hypothetical protein
MYRTFKLILAGTLLSHSSLEQRIERYSTVGYRYMGGGGVLPADLQFLTASYLQTSTCLINLHILLTTVLQKPCKE